MRETIYISITKTQLTELQKLIAESCSPADLNDYPDAKDFITAASRRFAEESILQVPELLSVARDIYNVTENSHIQIDNDAALSFDDLGTWVGAWVWVGFEDFCVTESEQTRIDDFTN